MIIKKCTDQFKYGCTLSAEVETVEELDKYFYKKNTWTGTYHQNVCKDCTKKKRRELYKSGQYDWRKNNNRDNFYSDKTFSVGKAGDD